MLDLLQTARTKRKDTTLPTDKGVYGLFLSPGSSLPDVAPGVDGLIYIGKAEGASGLLGRCHFNGATVKHSPRRSLAVLLKDDQRLEFRGYSGDKWGLSPASDATLSAWMHENLELAFALCANPGFEEQRLVTRFSPPLNLNICQQSEQHRKISELRKQAKSSVISGKTRGNEKSLKSEIFLKRPQCVENRPTRGEVDTANAIAKRYGLDAKRFRGELRKRQFSWHSLWNSWDVPRNTKEWRQMIEVAMEVSGHDLGEFR